MGRTFIKASEKFTFKAGGHTFRLELNGSGSGAIDSDLPRCESSDAVESLVLAHACAGLDVRDARYQAGLETALEAIDNNLGE
jgi:hypothetical protein